jgi:hypothetical protein
MGYKWITSSTSRGKHAGRGFNRPPAGFFFVVLVFDDTRPVRLRWLGPLFFRQLEADRHRHGVLHGWGSRLGACSVSKTDGFSLWGSIPPLTR